MGEIWREVVGFEGLYEVSDRGQVRSLDRLIESTTGQRYMRRGQTLKGSVGTHGYLVVTLRKNKTPYRKLVHRAVLEAFVGPCPEGQEGCHNNGIRTDCDLSNLRWDTHKANSQDKFRHGTVYQLDITHCPSGHEYTSGNTYRYDGRRYCRTCRSGMRRSNNDCRDHRTVCDVAGAN